MTNSKIKLIALCAGLAAVLAFMLFAMPTRAAEPVFPTGSRIGLVPPPGMTPSKTFPGFVDTDKNAGIVISALPAGAYADMEKTLTADALKKQGISVEKRESLQLNIGKGILVIGTQIAPDKTPYRKWLLLVPTNEITALVTVQVPERNNAYPDSVVRPALASLSLRDIVPDSELLSLLPFTIGDLAGYHIANAIPGRALMLIDAPKNPHLVATQGLPEYEFDARFMIAAAPGGPSDHEDRANFARFVFNTIGGIKDVQITMSEPVRLDNQQGFETVAQAKDAQTGADLMVVQWLRFGSGEFLQMIGISRADIWPGELPRLRAMRDSIELK